MSRISLAEAIAATPDPPCVGCSMWRRCAGRQLACRAFELYAALAPAKRVWAAERIPSAAAFARIFSGEPARRGRPRKARPTDAPAKTGRARRPVAALVARDRAPRWAREGPGRRDAQETGESRPKA
jgi:hypothetical protein